MISTKPTVCFVAAHSGGHMIPCMTLARKLQPTTRIMFMSLDRPLERNILQQYDFIDQITYVELPKFPYRQFWRYPKFIAQFYRSIRASYHSLQQQQVTRVITTGGVSAIPVCYAARLLRIPVEAYELNLEPGRAMRYIAPIAQKINVCFPISKRHFRANDQARCTLVRYPVRFTPQEQAQTKASVLQALPAQFPGFTVDHKTIFILGGSQGSAYLNSLAHELVKLRFKIQIVHQVGAQADQDYFVQLYREHAIPAYVFTYDAAMAPLYALTDVLITRAGAGVLAEIVFFGRPAIIVPLQTVQTAHQMANARSWSQLYPQMLRIVGQAELERDPELVLTRIKELL